MFFEIYSARVCVCSCSRMNQRKACELFRQIIGKNTTGEICRWIKKLLLMVLESRELLFLDFVLLAREPSRFADKKFAIFADALLALRTEMGRFLDRWWLLIRFFTPAGQVRMLDAMARTPSYESILSSPQVHRALKRHTGRRIPGAAILLARCNSVTSMSASQIIVVGENGVSVTRELKRCSTSVPEKEGDDVQCSLKSCSASVQCSFTQELNSPEKEREAFLVSVTQELKSGSTSVPEKEAEALLTLYPSFAVFHSSFSFHRDDPYFTHTEAASAMLSHNEQE